MRKGVALGTLLLAACETSGALSVPPTLDMAEPPDQARAADLAPLPEVSNAQKRGIEIGALGRAGCLKVLKGGVTVRLPDDEGFSAELTLTAQQGNVVTKTRESCLCARPKNDPRDSSRRDCRSESKVTTSTMGDPQPGPPATQVIEVVGEDRNASPSPGQSSERRLRSSDSENPKRDEDIAATVDAGHCSVTINGRHMNPAMPYCQQLAEVADEAVTEIMEEARRH